MLDCLENLGKHHIDAPDPYSLLKRYIIEGGLDLPTLKSLAGAHYSKAALEVSENA